MKLRCSNSNEIIQNTITKLCLKSFHKTGLDTKHLSSRCPLVLFLGENGKVGEDPPSHLGRTIPTSPFGVYDRVLWTNGAKREKDPKVRGTTGGFDVTKEGSERVDQRS